MAIKATTANKEPRTIRMIFFIICAESKISASGDYSSPQYNPFWPPPRPDGRNFMFELITGGRLAGAGFPPSFDKGRTYKWNLRLQVGLQCKRPFSTAGLPGNHLQHLGDSVVYAAGFCSMGASS